MPSQKTATEADAAPAQVPPANEIFHPDHYARYTIEPITFILANDLPFDVGCIIKYVCRYDAKGGREDVLKARRYCDILLERLDREDRIVQGEKPQDVWKEML